MKRAIVVFAIFVAICVFFFRPYFFSHKLLFPTNLLIGFYAPWNTMKFPGWEGGVPFKGLGHDNLNIFYPMKLLLRKSVREHSFPFWTPYNFAGAPLFGDGQSAVMYPLTLLYVLIPSLADAFSVMVLLIPFLTMLFTYGMLRHFRLSRIAAMFGAVAFAFCGFMSVWMEENPAVSQSAIWLPLLVWLIDLVITTPKRRWFILFAIVTAVMMASGFLQICLYELLFLAAYGIFRIATLPISTKKKWQRLGVVVLSGVIGLLLVAPYLTTTWESYKLSPRDFVNVPEIRSIFLVQWSHIISLFNPDWLGNPGSYNFLGVGSYYDKALFIGVIPLVFALIGLFSKKTTWEKFFWWVAAGTLLLGFSSPFTQWLFGLPIPILTSMLPSRIFYLSSFALVILAAAVFDKLRSDAWYKELPKIIRPVAAIYLLIIIILEAFLLVVMTEYNLTGWTAGYWAHMVRILIVSDMKLTFEIPSILLRNVAISLILTSGTLVILFVAYRMKNLRFWVPFVLFLLTIPSAWYFSSKSYYFGERLFLYPQEEMITKLQQIAGLNRIEFADEGSRIHASTNVVYGLYSPEGLNPVFPFRYGQLVKSAVNGGILTNDIPRISVDMDLRRASVDASASARISRLLALLGVKYITERKDTGWYPIAFPKHTIVWEGEHFRIWENNYVLPRAFVATHIVVGRNAQDELNTLYDAKTDLQDTAIVEAPVTIYPSKTDRPGTSSTAIITSYRMDDLTISVKSTQSGLLVLSDAYAPCWHARVDGKEAPIMRTDFAFRGVPVASGDHIVKMYYYPTSFVIGLWGLGAGILLLLGGTISIRFRSL